MHGLLILNKPAGITSRDVVDVVERWFPNVKVGHAGTLDPAATGVLLVCLGSATRLIEYAQRMSKTYAAVLRFGVTSDTDDATGQVQSYPAPRVPPFEVVRSVLTEFVGEIEQVPPTYSAAKIEGRRAHALARRGHAVQLAPRRVRIDGIDLIEYEYPRLTLLVHCGKGTYIRALARDAGERLGCGALLESLERTRIGPFHLSAALPLDVGAKAAAAHLLPPSAAVAELPRIVLDDAQAERIRHGQRLHLETSPLGAPGSGESELALCNRQGDLVAMVRWSAETHLLSPEKVMTAGQGSA
jgi:tRNA pseudouridine55 synthase